ncbi:hypothetical protein [Streptomyces caelestis]|uniref:Uncharacterized protein n=1 Tax=Streptomyces caelestis TaxID=36816 RepID=A0A7W9LWI4_9ACTN|nr:hypothetical protein [Streptomyces caelestis]MBB5798537.1 hypothetical protein [Streptomyces caelestis]GGW51064.1 hypothetical protein GCM10010320_34660 [Streptomyces caelestis]
MTTSTRSSPDRAADRDPAPGAASWARRVPRWAPGVLGAAAVAVGAALGQWYAPALAGAVLGVVAGVRGFGFLRTAVWAVVLGPLAWVPALLPWYLAGAAVTTDRTAAALAGVPDLGVTTLTLTLLVALVQVLVGVWPGRAAHGLLRHAPRRPRQPPDPE